MAVQYDVCEIRDSRRMTFARGQDGMSMSIKWTTGYQVIVSDPANPDLSAADISPLDVITAPGLPKVNRSIYYFNGKIIPFVVCQDKSALQDSKNGLRWVVTTQWGTNEDTNNEEDDLAEQEPPPQLSDLTPIVQVSYEESEQVIYNDHSPTRVPILTPTGNFYSEPTIERIPIIVLRITQYEDFLSYDDALLRMLKWNLTPYRGSPGGYWIIDNVEPLEVTVQLAGGPSVVAQVTYTLKYTTATSQGTPIGWLTYRALIDSHYYSDPLTQEKVAFVDDELYTETVGMVLSDGSKNPDQVQPDYDEFQTQPSIEFNDFLQV